MRITSLNITAAIAVALLAASLDAAVHAAGDPPPVSREFRAAWIATVANIDWPSKPGLLVKEQKEELIRLLDLAVDMKLNAVVFQVRPACDAMYKSELEPWSSFLTGRMGKSPKPSYDPLKFAVDEAHQRGLELHAWFNPYRASHPSSKGPIDERHISRTHPELIREYGEYLWLDPGEPGAVDHSVSVIMDVVQRYDVDAVHFDDYFYPYPITDKDKKPIPFPDDASWQNYLDGLGGKEPLSRDDWRRANVTNFLARLSREIHAAKPWVRFGISPFGIYRPGQPEGITGFDPYARLYADSRDWLQSGIVDYFSPQLYWPIDQEDQSYPVLLKYWHEQNSHQRHLWPGLFTSKVRDDSKKPWDAAEILRQIEMTRAQPGATGHIHFSIKALAGDWGGVTTQLREGLYAEPALIPESAWLGDETPKQPAVTTQRQPNGIEITMKPTGEMRPWLWVVRVLVGDRWQTQLVPGQNDHCLIESVGGDLMAEVAVSAVTRLGREGPLARAKIQEPN